jgi:anti-sigma factor (TIGR02949 family)
MGDIRSCRDLEERLTPYVDGEATPDARRQTDVHLAKCPPCRERMEVERAAREIVHERRSALRPSAPQGLKQRCAAHRASVRATSSGIRRWVPLSVAATLLLAIAAVFALGLNDRVEALAAGLTLDHVKCFNISPRSRIVPDAHALEARWQSRQGWAVTIPDTEPAENLRLVDVRRCLSTDGRVAHLMYLWRGEPLSVYVLPKVLGRDRVLDTMGHQAAIWSANGRTYAVLANGHPQDFDTIVGYVKTHAK